MKIKALFPMILILSIFIALPTLMTSPLTSAQALKPSIFVDPKDSVFTTSTTPVGSTFNVSIMASDWVAPGVFSFEFKLYYDQALLEPVRKADNKTVFPGIPSDAWIRDFVAADGLVDPSGFLHFSATLLGAAGNIGSGLLGVATFKIIKEPASGKTLTSSLSLQGNATDQVIIVNPDTVAAYPLDYYDIVSGTFQYTSTAPPAALPVVFVDPKDSTFTNSTTNVGHNFTISIKTVNWTEPGVFGYAFKLLYNNSLIEPVAANIPNGHWLTPANTSNILINDPGTINQTAGHVSFNATLLSNEQGKTGGGTIATITFTILQAPPSGGNVACILDISDIVLVDPTGTTIPSNQYEVIDGSFKYSSAPTTTADLNGDGKVNIEDIAIWAKAFGSRQGQPRFDPMADQNGDGIINMIDAVQIAMQWTRP